METGIKQTKPTKLINIKKNQYIKKKWYNVISPTELFPKHVKK
jgi:ribosomal protein S3AE